MKTMDWRQLSILWTERKYRYRLLLLIAVLGLWGFYNFLVYHFTYSSDAYIYAHTIDVNAQVPGHVAQIFIKDNQAVKAGQVLFTLDQRPYQYAVQKAIAELKQAQSELLTTQKNSLHANVDRATAIVHQAQYNLEHATIRAATDGVVTNFNLRVGDYVKTGQPLFALIDTARWWIMTRYRETVLRNIAINDRVLIHVDMYPHKTFHGIVDSIGWGINRKQASNTVAKSSLPYLEASEDWIRIAQRFPVRIRITDVDPNYPLRVGANARTYVR